MCVCVLTCFTVANASIDLSASWYQHVTPPSLLTPCTFQSLSLISWNDSLTLHCVTSSTLIAPIYTEKCILFTYLCLPVYPSFSSHFSLFHLYFFVLFLIISVPQTQMTTSSFFHFWISYHYCEAERRKEEMTEKEGKEEKRNGKDKKEGIERKRANRNKWLEGEEWEKRKLKKRNGLKYKKERR